MDAQVYTHVAMPVDVHVHMCADTCVYARARGGYMYMQEYMQKPKVCLQNNF